MSRRRTGIAAAATGAVLAAVLAAILGGGSGSHAPVPRPVGLVEAHAITYTSSFDKSQVTGLLATPRAVASRGCVIWQFGFRSRKEDSARVWDALAALGLSTFSIDMRYHGSRGTRPGTLERVLNDPHVFAKLVRGTVADLKSAIDELERRPACAHNLAYVGVSLGGAIGTILAAQDKRVKAAALVVTPGSWGDVLTTPGDPLLPGVARDPARFKAALRIVSPLDPARYVARISPRPVLILSGRQDATVLFANARRLQSAARRPKTVVDFSGGHDPTVGPDATRNAEAIASFLLRTVVEPSYGINAKPNGTFAQQ